MTWDGPARWINTMLLVVLGVIGFDTLFRLLEARQENAIVAGVRAVAGLILAPFEGMFAEQDFLMTAIVAAMVYCLLAAIVLAFVRSVQSTVHRPRVVATSRRVHGDDGHVEPRRPAAAGPRVPDRVAPGRAATQRLDGRRADVTRRL